MKGRPRAYTVIHNIPGFYRSLDMVGLQLCGLLRSTGLLSLSNGGRIVLSTVPKSGFRKILGLMKEESSFPVSLNSSVTVHVTFLIVGPGGRRMRNVGVWGRSGSTQDP